MSLREAAQRALEALTEINSPLLVREITRIGEAMSGLRAALAEDAMQRLTDEQQMIERGTKAWADVPDSSAWVNELRGNEPVTDRHDLEQARASAISNLLEHFGITSANSDVNVAYLHKQLDDFLTGSVGRSKDGWQLAHSLPTLAVHVGYRYQSPVGGWEYGDHIPAGFDTGKWAYQKIYILQEQS